MKDLDNLTPEKIIEPEEIPFSEFETIIAEKLNITPEAIRKLLIESESLEEFLSKLNIN